MSDDILKLYKSITSKNNQPQEKTEVVLEKNNPENAKNDAKTKSQINYLNINLNDYLNVNRSSQPIIQQNQTRFFESENFTSEKKREKCSKGLRHFSMKVCEKVKQKGITTYNQVAEELVSEYCSNTNAHNSSIQNDFMNYDQKNVRRRVYDALNVLMAMNIISKEKKEIRWIGLPCNTKQECHDLELDKKKRQERIEQKSEILKNLILEQIALKSLIERNKEVKQNETSEIIQLPFIILNTDSTTNIDCNISSDRKEYSIQLDNTFEIKSDFEALKRLGFNNGLGETNSIKDSETNEFREIVSMVPEAFQSYIFQLNNKDKIEPICFDHSEFPNFMKVLKPNLFENNKTNRMVKKYTKLSNKMANLLGINSKDDDSNEAYKNEDTDTNCPEETDEENSFENYEDEEDADEEEGEEELGDEEDEDEENE
ncbi:unnamed protein product [Brachionus calyciflorus]|uniref:Uncharacterized protein n=1 Tax=Brachionus calyciflorus TaxID=104777 RepID=A0A813PI45_9BILA|nr:unnamed protein product [Brachionus calyciflorus]